MSENSEKISRFSVKYDIKAEVLNLLEAENTLSLQRRNKNKVRRSWEDGYNSHVGLLNMKLH